MIRQCTPPPPFPHFRIPSLLSHQQDTVARQEWEFDGYITSDCDADQDVVSSHHYHNDTAAEGVRDVLKAGTDVDCGGLVGGNAQAALEQKLITVDDIDARLKMLFRVRMRCVTNSS